MSRQVIPVVADWLIESAYAGTARLCIILLLAVSLCHRTLTLETNLPGRHGLSLHAPSLCCAL